MTRPRPAAERFWAKVERTGECWLWTAGTKDGYGRFRIGGAGSPRVLAHRYAYEQLVGPIPDGLFIDHLCRNRQCVNPDHLEPVTNAENMRRWAATITHCPHGHKYAPDNLVPSSKHRRCLTCHRQQNRDAQRRRREMLDAAA